MDKAICGFCRSGYCRSGVYRPDWDRMLTLFQNVSAKTVGGVTPCIQGSARQAQTRHRVYVPLFDELKEKMKETV